MRRFLFFFFFLFCLSSFAYAGQSIFNATVTNSTTPDWADYKLDMLYDCMMSGDRNNCTWLYDALNKSASAPNVTEIDNYLVSKHGPGDWGGGGGGFIGGAVGGQPLIGGLVSSVDSDMNFLAEPTKMFGDMRAGDEIFLTFNGFNVHTFYVHDVSSSAVTFEYDKVLPIRVSLQTNREVDVNNDGISDFSVKVEKIDGGQVAFTLFRYEGAVSVARSETNMDTSVFFDSYGIFVLALLVLILVVLGWDRKESRVRFFGIVVASVFSLVVILDNWRAPFQIIGWIVAPSTIASFEIGFGIMTLFYVLVYLVAFRRSRKA